MPKPITNVQVTQGQTNYLVNGSGTLHDDYDPNTYIIVSGGTRPNPLVKNDRYTIKCDEGGNPRTFFFYCTFTGDPTEFRLVKAEAPSGGAEVSALNYTNVSVTDMDGTQLLDRGTGSGDADCYHLSVFACGKFAADKRPEVGKKYQILSTPPKGGRCGVVMQCTFSAETSEFRGRY